MRESVAVIPYRFRARSAESSCGRLATRRRANPAPASVPPRTDPGARFVHAPASACPRRAAAVAAALLALSGAVAFPATGAPRDLDEAPEAVAPKVASGGGICSRTEAVRDAIVARIWRADDCTRVTMGDLARLRGQLRLDNKEIGSLQAGDFAGLSRVTEIWLDNNRLTGLPADLFVGLRSLEILQLGGNRLATLQADVFDGLPELWFLDLSNNRLTSVSAGAFNGLPALDQLILGANPLNTLPADVFDGLSALWFLDLEDTRLSSLPAGLFDGLAALEELNLEANRLTTLPAAVFGGLSSLTELTLVDNQLTSVPADVFDGLSSLTTLYLDRNRLGGLPAGVFDGLASLTDLTLMGNQLTSLPADVFDGLSSLRWISLPGNRLTSLPDGVFEGLAALEIFEVQDNAVAPMVLTVSLARVGDNGLQARVPAGAPFTMTLPVDVANGGIDGGATTLTIPVGAVRSGAVTVVRTTAATAAVTARIGPVLPPLPSRHLGYTLARAPGPPLEVLPELPPALSVADARATEGVDGALVFVVTLDRSAPGEVTVSYATSDATAAAGQDYEAGSGTLSFAPGETHKTVVVAVLDDALDEGEETLVFALSGVVGAVIADGRATGTVVPAPGICARTRAVRDAIVARVESARDCAQVTARHLAWLTDPLDLEDRGITSLKAGDFAGLSGLTEIWLDHNQLTGLSADLFDGLAALWFLDLSNNRLTGLSAGAFNGLPALEYLVLGANPLNALPADVFDGLAALWFLDLEEAGLSDLPADVFDGLAALEELNLEANRLRALPADVFDGLSSLTSLLLKENQLASVPGDVFDGLSSLTTLRLDQNRLDSLPANLFAGLSSLQELYLHTNRLTSAGLPPDVFDGLSSLYRLNMRNNRLTTLPDGLFAGLSALTTVELYGNPVDPMVVTVSLERVGDDGFKATVPAGAPFTMTLPVSVANGSIDGGATTLAIHVGAVQSAPLTVTRTAGTTAVVTAAIGASLPAPPPGNLGYALARAPGPPLEVLPEPVPAPRIVGVPQVGSVLQASFAEPPGDALAYRWLRGSEVIADAAAGAYAPTAADVGARLSVRVGRGGDSKTSAATAPVWPAPANPPLRDGEEELLSATVTLGWHEFPLWVAGYGRLRGESFGGMDVVSFEDGGATYAVDGLFVNSRGVFGLSTGSASTEASGLVAYWDAYRIPGLQAHALNGGALQVLVGRTPQSETEYGRYADGASDGVRVAVSLRRIGRPVESPVVSVADARAVEGDAVGFAVSLSAAASGPVTVGYATSGGSAESGTDFTAASGTVTIGADSTSMTVRVATTDDALDEADETFTLTLSSPTNATLGTATATGTIIDDDEPSRLTARFEGMPAEHRGRGSFRFRLAFSDGIRISFRTVRDSVFRVTAGDVTKARRVDRRRDLWDITVAPDSDAAVRIHLPETTDCGAAAAICTRDGRPLSHALSAAVAGPAGLSVADAEADEGPGATMRFVVALDRAAVGPVTVDWTTADGTARAGDDYEAAQGTLTLAPGGRSATVAVTVLDDSVDDGGETFRLLLSNPSGARLRDAEGIGTIRNADPLPRAWLVRFGRTAADHAVDAITERLESPHGDSHATFGPRLRIAGGRSSGLGPGGGPSAPRGPFRTAASTLGAVGQGLGGTATGGTATGGTATGGTATGGTATGGTATGGTATGGASAGPMRKGMHGGMRNPVAARGDRAALYDLLLGGSFRLSAGDDRDGGSRRLTGWGRTAATRFTGVSDGVSVDGEAATLLVGADAAWDRWLAGVSVAHSLGAGTFRGGRGGAGDAAGELGGALTAVHPYVRYQATGRLSAWGVLGYGAGNVTLATAGSTWETDTTMRMAAVGARAVFAPAPGGLELAAKTDLRMARIASDAVAGEAGLLAAAAAGTSRLRLLLEGSRRFAFGSTRTLTPTLELGVRRDGGDAETGAGMDLGASLRYADAALGLVVDARGRFLVAHEDAAYREWGASASIRVDPGTPGRGLTLSVMPSWGAAATGGAERLWSMRDARGLAGRGFDPALRLRADVEYGLPAFAGKGVVAPFAGLSTMGARRDWRAGARWTRGAALVMSLEATRRESAGAPPAHGIEFGARWWLGGRQAAAGVRRTPAPHPADVAGRYPEPNRPGR